MSNYRAKMPDAAQNDLPLHSIFVGHNPSIATWQSGYYFANPSNQFWKLLKQSQLLVTKSGISKTHATSNMQTGETNSHHLEKTQRNEQIMLANGFGFTDFIESPGNDANAITKEEIKAAKDIFATRIEKYANDINSQLKRICFIGKKQWKQQFTPNLKRCKHGLQDAELRPLHWPKRIKELEVWVLPSPSGRAVISKQERLHSYAQLADILNQ